MMSHVCKAQLMQLSVATVLTDQIASHAKAADPHYSC